ncbi:very short patch repair endonuclease [Burkholderia gladioli]|uniref:very short patch repair endonuclease n=1 Tax=Burkholderia gladioli TaxID=28095 RepID=UPI00068B1C83|nr:DNA mismatch endonuclease Vsr [Burkholderia gladioli]
MVDRLTVENRSRLMARVRQRDTQPEMAVRRALHKMGFRFRLHRKDLPGCPDIVLPRFRLAIFVHGCFWHQHAGCGKAKLPSTRTDWWAAKLEKNTLRDQRAVGLLEQSGWRAEIVWECQTFDEAALTALIQSTIPYAQDREI